MVSGFTLLEVLVVLVIAGFLTGIALPKLQQIVRSSELAGQRNALVTELESLGYRAYLQGQAFSLATSAGAGVSLEGEVPLKIPTGWKIETAHPVHYSLNGMCSGGNLTLVAADGRKERYVLKPPLCRLEPEA